MKNSATNLIESNTPAHDHLHDIALQYAEKGLRVLPLRPNEKTPAISGGHKSATTNVNTITGWFSADANYNVGIATGVESNVFVLDVDVKDGAPGNESLSWLESQHGKLPETLRCTTGTGGAHFYFAYPSGTPIRNRTSLLPGIDVRGEGGYAVAAPSIVSGRPYRWDNDGTPLAAAPDWLVRLITAKNSLHLVSSHAPAQSAETAVLQGGRNEALMSFILRNMKAGLERDEVQGLAMAFNQNVCSPALEQAEVLQILENVFRLYEDKLAFRCSDLGNARKMARRYSSTVRYVIETGQWLQWNGVYWQRISEVHVAALAKDTVSAIAEEARELADGDLKTRLLKHAKASERAKAIVDMISMLKSEKGILTTVDELDKHDYLFPVKNGVVDLKTGQFSPPDPSMLITHIAGVNFDPEATCPQWERFLLKIMGGHEDIVSYLQQAVGYTLTSLTSEQCLFFIHGFGANGKSTFLNILRALFGDVGIQASAETLLDTGIRSSSAPSPDLARLNRKRLVAVSEVDDGKHLAEGRVKSLTGGDPITARPLYGAPIEYTPIFKLWLAANHKPTIKGNDDGIWRRMRLIPFDVRIPKSEQDPLLETKLRDELPGILNWAIKGCLSWQANGNRLMTPAAIERATDEYRDDSDIVGCWVREFCVEGPFFELNFDEAYRLFEPWCKENFAWAWSKNKLGRRFKERGYVAETRNGRVYRGLCLRDRIPPSALKEDADGKFGHLYGSKGDTKVNEKPLAKKLLSFDQLNAIPGAVLDDNEDDN